jgi:ABC-2 type transport system permease protein
MFRSIWLVARREYIGYVSALGFWVGLLLTPIGLALGIMAPSLLSKTQAAKYYTVIDQGSEIKEALDWQFESWQSQQTLTLINQAIASYSPAEKRRILNAYGNARAKGQSAQNALKATRLDLPILIPPPEFIHVPVPISKRGEIEQLLGSGEAFNGPIGKQALFAAIIVQRDQVGDVISVDYISPDVVNPGLRQALNGALKYLSRMDLFSKAGLSTYEIRMADVDIPEIYTRKPGSTDFNSTTSEDQQEVTLTDRAPYFAAAAIAFSLWLLIFSVVNFLLTGTIEERSNKIFDTLLTSVNLVDLLAGKLLGVLMLSVTLVSVWSLMGLWAALNVGELASPAVMEFLSAALNPSLILPALAGFLAGYIMYGALFLALGALCETIQEAQTLSTPLILLMMVPLFMVGLAVQNPSSSLILAMSWVPLFTPFLMILRAPLEPPLYQTLMHLLIMAGSTYAAVLISIRIYRAGAVHGRTAQDMISAIKNTGSK